MNFAKNISCTGNNNIKPRPHAMANCQKNYVFFFLYRNAMVMLSRNFTTVSFFFECKKYFIISLLFFPLGYDSHGLDFRTWMNRSNPDLSELILLRIFYAKPDHFSYRQYIAKNWFEFLSKCILLLKIQNDCYGKFWYIKIKIVSEWMERVELLVFKSAWNLAC